MKPLARIFLGLMVVASAGLAAIALVRDDTRALVAGAVVALAACAVTDGARS